MIAFMLTGFAGACRFIGRGIWWWQEGSRNGDVNLGVIGPRSSAEQPQDLVNDIPLIDTFEGWDNPLKSELGGRVYTSGNDVYLIRSLTQALFLAMS